MEKANMANKSIKVSLKVKAIAQIKKKNIQRLKAKESNLGPMRAKVGK